VPVREMNSGEKLCFACQRPVVLSAGIEISFFLVQTPVAVVNGSLWFIIFPFLKHLLYEQAAVTNSATQLLLKRDIMAKLRLEYDLWCPLTESFAPNPFVAADDELSRLPGDVAAYPHNVTKDHDRMCRESCAKMQEQVLGFVPKGRTSLGKEIAARHRRHRQQKKRPDFFKELSSAMSELYYAEYEVSDKVWKRREKVRATVEVIVSRSAEFPPGTKVAVFGSSANGFG